MKVRVKFSRQGCMKFVGHLDMMRYFQKAIRRAKIDVAYSAGFSPHMIMSFAAPLGVGLTSDGEYFDIEVGVCLSSKEMVRRLNEVMVEEMKILSFLKIEEGKAGNAMAIVAAADYTVTFRDGYKPVSDWEQRLQEFYKQDSITILKKTKKSEKEIDIKPMIYSLSCSDGIISMQLATGSVNNLKPDLVLEAFAQYLGIQLPAFVLEVNRVEVYANEGTEEERKLIALEAMGEEIV